MDFTPDAERLAGLGTEYSALLQRLEVADPADLGALRGDIGAFDQRSRTTAARRKGISAGTHERARTSKRSRYHRRAVLL